MRSEQCIICYAHIRAVDSGLCDAHKYDEQLYGVICERSWLHASWCAHCLGHELDPGTPLTGGSAAPWLFWGYEREGN